MNSRTLLPWAGWWWWWWVDFMNTPSLGCGVDFMNTPSLGGGRGLHEHSFLGVVHFMNTPSLGGGRAAS